MNTVRSSEHTRQYAGDYQPVSTPSGDVAIDTGLSHSDDSDARPKWQRFLRESRAVEFAFAIVMYIIARRLGRWIEVYQRAIPRIEMRLNSTTIIWGRDPALDQEKLSSRGKHAYHDHHDFFRLTAFAAVLPVPMWLLVTVGPAIPIGINLVINYVLPKIVGVRVIPHDVRDHLLSLGQAITLSTLLVNFTKNVTGRFRPCFYDDCGWNYDVVWDGVTNLCSDPSGERDGRQSFPSGHASFAWSAMGVLTLYLLGRSRLNCDNRSESLLHDGVKTFKFFCCFLPCFGAAWVAITRTQDNRHHYSDIVAGSVVGTASACLAYYHNYGSIYSWKHAGVPLETIHERRKVKKEEIVDLEDVRTINFAQDRISTKMPSLSRVTEPRVSTTPDFSPTYRRASSIASDVPFMESITSVAEVPGLAGPDSRPRVSKWERIVRDYRIAEFTISVLMYGFALFFAKIEVAQRDIPNIEVRLNSTTSVWARDPTINNKEHAQQVSMAALVGVGGGMPVIINLIINYALPKCRPVRIIPHDTRDFLLTLVQSTSMATLLTQFTKNMTGRFRPCFYDMCKWDYDAVWDGVTNLCTSASGEKEGRKSFPSGHASFAWSTMLVLTLYLLGRSTLNCQNRSETLARGGRKTLKLFLCFVPSFLAAWVAVTRTIDNWHHYADILAGSIIGAVAACLSYSYNYSSIFHSEHAGVPLQHYHTHAQCQGKPTSNSSNMTYIGSSGSLSQGADSGNELGKGSKARSNEYVMNVHSS